MNNNNNLTKVTYTKTGAIYETYNVEKIRVEISKMYEDFRDNKIKEILSANEELLEKYFPNEGEPKDYFPIMMQNPGFYVEYEIKCNPTFLKEHPLIIKNLNNELGKIQSNIINHWNQGLVEIGFLNNPE